MNLKDTIEGLPKPFTPEEQYLYSLVCETAGIPPKEGYLHNSTTFQSPFWRMQQYWHAFCEATKIRLGLPVIPSDDTVGMGALTEEVSDGLLGPNKVSSVMLKDKSVTEFKLADAVVARLLDTGVVTEEMLAQAVIDRLLGTNKITLEMLQSSVTDKLLGDNKVTTSMLDDALRGRIEALESK